MCLQSLGLSFPLTLTLTKQGLGVVGLSLWRLSRPQRSIVLAEVGEASRGWSERPGVLRFRA